jgi:EAL domain-containing protein (putative c-di-GMP-specific phosphodiesterase class I)/GGDEF domain-containing protein/DNA-binding response OmpR family regulator
MLLGSGITATAGLESMDTSKQIVIYPGDGTLADEQCRWLEQAGLSVKQASSFSLFEKFAESKHVAALIVDLSQVDSEISCIEAVAQLMAGLSRSPGLIFLSDRADQEVRLHAVRAGGDCFLLKPVSPAMLLSHLEPVLLAATHSYRVLLIGESQGLLLEEVSILQQQGVMVKQVDTVSEALLTVINQAPDLLMIEQELSCCRGDQLGKMFHQLADYADLPVIYLVAESADIAGVITDHASEALCPALISDTDLVDRIHRLAGSARLRRNYIHYLKTSDVVTELVNQPVFLQRLQRRVMVVDDLQQVTALLIIETENIHQQHPQLSPQSINQLMKMLASQLAALVGQTDCLARTGDYCFACLVSGRSEDEIRQLGDFLGHTLSARILDVGDVSLTIGCKLGVAMTSRSIESAMPLYFLAHKACDEARLDAGQHVVVRGLEVAGSGKKDQEEKQLLAVLEDAVENSRFSLVYQPIASLRGSVDEKYEVLLRLQDSNKGAVSPSRFVSLADDHGLMIKIDRWVVEQAVQTLQQRGKDACFFVKVSPGTLTDTVFMAFLKDSLERNSVAGRQLVFQLSIASINAGIRQAAAFSRQLTRLGCGVSIEHCDADIDVARLYEHIPAAYVKLGGDMIRNLETDHGRQLQLLAVVQQSVEHDAEVIAGFVESAACLKMLWKSGVQYIQGNFLQEPDEVLGFDFGGSEA